VTGRQTPARLADSIGDAMLAESWLNFVTSESHGVRGVVHEDQAPDFQVTTQDGAVYRVLVQIVKEPENG
jgi:hypothetical protein